MCNIGWSRKRVAWRRTHPPGTAAKKLVVVPYPATFRRKSMLTPVAMAVYSSRAVTVWGKLRTLSQREASKAEPRAQPTTACITSRARGGSFKGTPARAV